MSTDVVTISDDSEEEMSVFKQPGKKRKINNSRDLVSGFLRPGIIMDGDNVLFIIYMFCFQDEFDGKNKSNDDSIMTNDSSANNSLMTEDEDENNEPQTGTKIPKKSK